MKNIFFFVLTFFVVIAVFSVEPALAGPGGKIAKAVYESFWGKIGLVLLAIIFLPFIISIIIKEKLAERRTRKDLRFMAGHSSKFEWLKVQERAKDCFFRVHSAWDKGDLSGVSYWMTDWYWQNQQLVHLEKWKVEGLVNVCDIKKITHIKPLLFVHRNQGTAHEDSMIVISIGAKVQDYSKNIQTGKIVEGSKKYKEVETFWSFTMDNGNWKVSDIEEDGMSLACAKLIKELPDIETTVVSELRA